MLKLRDCLFSYKDIPLTRKDGKVIHTRANPPFRDLITQSDEFDFGMNDIARIREEIRTLIEKLSDHYVEWKKEKDNADREEKKAEKAAKLAAKKDKESEETAEQPVDKAKAVDASKIIAKPEARKDDQETAETSNLDEVEKRSKKGKEAKQEEEAKREPPAKPRVTTGDEEKENNADLLSSQKLAGKERGNPVRPASAQPQSIRDDDEEMASSKREGAMTPMDTASDFSLRTEDSMQQLQPMDVDTDHMDVDENVDAMDDRMI
jgi:hypothetical protein